MPDENSSSFATFINTFFSIAAKFILGFFGMVCAIVAFVMLCLILSLVAGIIVYSVTGNPNILDGLDIFSENSPVTTARAFICLFFSIMLPFILIARYAAVPLLRFKVPSAATLITAIIIELLFITATVVLYNIAYNFDSAGTVFAVVQTTGSLGADPIHCLLPSPPPYPPACSSPPPYQPDPSACRPVLLSPLPTFSPHPPEKFPAKSAQKDLLLTKTFPIFALTANQPKPRMLWN